MYVEQPPRSNSWFADDIGKFGNLESVPTNLYWLTVVHRHRCSSETNAGTMNFHCPWGIRRNIRRVQCCLCSTNLRKEEYTQIAQTIAPRLVAKCYKCYTGRSTTSAVTITKHRYWNMESRKFVWTLLQTAVGLQNTPMSPVSGGRPFFVLTIYVGPYTYVLDYKNVMTACRAVQIHLHTVHQNIQP